MAKSKNSQVSQHSRAARRAASPSIDLDKSITSIKASTDSVDYVPKTGAQDAGVSKKKKQKPMTRSQRLRREKGLERADKNLDVLEQKTAKSMARGRKVNDRRANWEDLNNKVTHGVQSKSSKSSKSVDQEDDDMSEDEAAPRRSVFSNAMPGDDEEQHQEQPQEQASLPDATVTDNVDDDIDEVL